MLNYFYKSLKVKEDHPMRKALASVAIIIFTGLLCTSLLAVFNGSRVGSQSVNSQYESHSYYMAY